MHLKASVGKVQSYRGSGIAVCDETAKNSGTRQASQHVETGRGEGEWGEGGEGAQQRQLGKTKDRSKAAGVKKMHEKVTLGGSGVQEWKSGAAVSDAKA